MSKAGEQRAKEHYRKALNLADTVWRSENDGVLNQDRLVYLREQYVAAVFADLMATREREARRQGMEEAAQFMSIYANGNHEDKARAMAIRLRSRAQQGSA